MTTKELKKLAKMCREQGITHYKCAHFEFTLSDSPPPAKAKAGEPQQKYNFADSPFETDSLTQDQLLMWSTPSDPEEESKTQ